MIPDLNPQPDQRALARRLVGLNPAISEADALRMLRELRLAEVALTVHYELPRTILHGLQDLVDHLDAMGVPDGAGE